MRRGRPPLPILSDESVGENYRSGKRLPFEAPGLRGTPGHNCRVAVKVYLHV